MHAQPTCVLACDNELGECPIWCPTTRRLWWIDVARPTLWRFDPATGASENWPLSKPPAAIALRRSGGLLILFRRGYALIDAPPPGAAIGQTHGLDLGEERFNDGKVAPDGRMWVGSMDRALKSPIGRLYRFTPDDGADSGLQPMDEGFVLSNGLGWSPDGRALYFAETRSKHVYKYDRDPVSGAIGTRQLFTTLDGEGVPDGLTVDAAGHIWIAAFGGSAVHRFRPDGSLASRTALPVEHPTSCTFGGDDLRVLYITSARRGIEGNARAMPQAGGLWAVRLDVAGLPETPLSC
ncbi:SMP-30/gluconolactonase/LRE family protein [Azospirillum sp. YIM DDC1]|uniref:SMP-30/gluconolactonase/LRE family protein n=1 Tax=Azospirillum aestuarii TaxID=2802052 RepID=A0ABS1I1R6_9PROT|nr:SMP-30/gluconolactonase/LRE family protein [Azospirillum aestuarii]MBK4720915.1 SMP-30/gluconolactonase/LRE family protein [Azospirillum aestuarii]